MTKMTEVYTIEKSVRYEGSTIECVYADESNAVQEARTLAEKHRYEGEWEEWVTGDPHIISLSKKDVTFVVKRWEVES